MTQQNPPFVLRDVGTGQQYPISPGGLRIGRLPQNDVVLNDDQTSRYHAILWVQDNLLYLRDENSTNGTWVNERRITAPTLLQPGDQVRVGATVFRVMAGQVAPGPAAPPRPAVRPAGPRPMWPLLAGVAGMAVVLVALIGGLLLASRRDAIGSGTTASQPTVTSTPATQMPTPTVQGATSPSPTPTLTPTPTRRPTWTPPPCLPDASFVEDVTVPDGTRFTPGEPFTKTWRMRSSGCVPWATGSQWAFVSGEQMGAPDNVAVPDTPLGDTADIAVPMQAPTTPGTYRGYWQMQSPGGQRFGERAFVVIIVPTPTPSPTRPPLPTATPTPDTRPTASILIRNETNDTLKLDLVGPETYHFTFSPGDRRIEVVAGSYTYTARGCGGAIKSGTQALFGLDEWRWWCSAF